MGFNHDTLWAAMVVGRIQGYLNYVIAWHVVSSNIGQIVE